MMKTIDLSGATVEVGMNMSMDKSMSHHHTKWREISLHADDGVSVWCAGRRNLSSFPVAYRRELTRAPPEYKVDGSVAMVACNNDDNDDDLSTTSGKGGDTQPHAKSNAVTSLVTELMELYVSRAEHQRH